MKRLPQLKKIKKDSKNGLTEIEKSKKSLNEWVTLWKKVTKQKKISKEELW